MAILETFTPLVQPISIDEAFLDVSGGVKKSHDAVEIACRIKDEISRRTDLTASIGVAPNKFLAKLASDLNKPDGLTVIAEKDKVQVLAPLTVSKIWGVGKVTERRLQELGIHTIGDLQRFPVNELRRRFGNAAERLHSLALGEDDRGVLTEEETKSISSENTFDADTDNLDRIKRCLLEQVEAVATRLRKERLAARTVQLKLRYADFTTLTRRKTLSKPTQDEMVLYEVAEQLLIAERIQGRLIRLIGVGGSNLVPPEIQGDLFDPKSTKRTRLNKAVDDLRAKLGPDAVKRGTSLR
jgi:DNA polymerase-4